MTKNQIFRNLELIGMIIVDFVLLIFVLYCVKYITDLFYIYDVPDRYWFLSLLAFSIPMSMVFEGFEIIHTIYRFACIRSGGIINPKLSI